MRSFFLSASIACVSVAVLVTARPTTDFSAVDMGGIALGHGTATTWNANRLDYFVRGTDNAMYHRWFLSGTWYPANSGWENLGGIILTPPSCTAWADNRIDCFVVGTNNHVFHKCFDGAWHDWDDIGGIATSELSCVSRESLSLDCYTRGTDNAMYRISWVNGSGWTAWVSYGGILTSAPTCVAVNKQVMCYVIGTDGQMYSRNGVDTSGTWSTFEKPIPDYVYADAPSAFGHVDGCIEILARGKGGQMYRIRRQSSTGPLGEWEKVNYPGNVPVVGIARGSNTIDYFTNSDAAAVQQHTITL